MPLTSSHVWVVSFPLARYPTVMHPSASQRLMSDRARTPSEDGEKKGCEYWIRGGRGFHRLRGPIKMQSTPQTSGFFFKIRSWAVRNWFDSNLALFFLWRYNSRKNKATCITHAAHLWKIKKSSWSQPVSRLLCSRQGLVWSRSDPVVIWIRPNPFGPCHSCSSEQSVLPPSHRSAVRAAHFIHTPLPLLLSQPMWAQRSGQSDNKCWDF